MEKCEKDNGLGMLPDCFFGHNKISIKTPHYTLTIGATDSLKSLKLSNLIN